MERLCHTLTLYGHESDAAPLDWEWVDAQLSGAGTYWVVVDAPDGGPHPRPVWGVWWAESLHLSIGSPVNVRRTVPGATATVHLDSGTDVVIVNGVVDDPTTDTGLVANYSSKYDRPYSVEEYGPLTTILPTEIIAWQSSGWAGRGGFQRAGRWTFVDPPR